MLFTNTHKTVQELTAEKAFTKKQAERIIDVLVNANDQVATKADIDELAKATRADLRHETQKLRSELLELKADTKSEFAISRKELYRAMLIQTVGILGFMVAILPHILK